MKVLHVEDRFHPGMGYQINFFARYHNPAIRFHILSSDSARLWTGTGEGADLERADREFEKLYHVSIRRLPTRMDRKAKTNLWMMGLVRAIREENPDILYVHTMETFTALRIVLQKSLLESCPVFFDTHTLKNQIGKGIKFRFHLWILRNLVGAQIRKLGAKVFATVPENRIILEELYGIPRENILYTPIGTDLDLFRFDEGERKIFRREMKLGDDSCVLLYTGKLNRRKNPHLILDALALVEQEIEIPLRVVFVGAAEEGYQESHMDRSFQNPLIRIENHAAVPVAELFRWYSMADFAVFPNENTLSALDAQACRLPVLMESDMTNDERLSRGGLTYEKGRMEDLAGKIMDLMHDPDLRKKLGSQGEGWVKSAFEYRNIVRNMEKDLGIPG